ncbi:MAG: septum formation initiator family protein [Acidimicrobiia bacterium]
MIITRSRLALVLTLALLISAAALFTNILPFRQILAQHDALDRATARLELLQEENGRLSEEVTALMSDAEVERIAREYFGYVMPGELAIVIVAPSGEPMPRPVTVVPTEVDRALWQTVWDFLTGHDLTD